MPGGAGGVVGAHHGAAGGGGSPCREGCHEIANGRFAVPLPVRMPAQGQAGVLLRAQVHTVVSLLQTGPVQLNTFLPVYSSNRQVLTSHPDKHIRFQVATDSFLLYHIESECVEGMHVTVAIPNNHCL